MKPPLARTNEMHARSFSTRFLGVALFLFCGLCSYAATQPLSYPKGLAVDSKGNLYVANSGGNDILIYNSSYVQITSATITSNISNPTGVAFDTPVICGW